jgi:hypothetical protein
MSKSLSVSCLSGLSAPFACLMACANLAFAQVSSTLYLPGNVAPRTEHALVYDATSQRVLMIGGAPDGAFMAWDGQAWSPIPGSAPTSRRGAAMVCDRNRHRVVLFGGQDTNTSSYPTDVWEWEGQAWTQHIVPGPVGRDGHAMAYDAHRGRVVLFGGRSNVGTLGDTWEWDGVQWMPRFASANPVGRWGASMGFDPSRNSVVMSGGQAASGVRDDTWAWNGSSWTLVEANTSGQFGHQSRYGASMAYHERWGGCVSFGGSTTSSSFTMLEVLRGNRWVSYGAINLFGAVGGSAGAMAFDESRQELVYAGMSTIQNRFATWTIVGSPPSTAAFGMGCGPQPASLQTVPAAPPVIGRTAQLSMQGAALDFGFLAIGTSKFWMGGFPLPIALDGLGMPGCGILQSNDIHSSYPSSSGSAGIANFTLPIPPNVFFLGVELHLQAWAPDPAANTAGIVLTNGLTWTIGDY